MATNEKSSAVLTDADIKTSLECCSKFHIRCHEYHCEHCFLNDKSSCIADLINYALDFINRLEADKEALIAGQETLQKALAEKNAEIERLNRLLAEWKTQAYKLSDSIDNIKAETTEQLSKKIESRLANNTDISNVQYQSIIFDISEACKEMVGDAE